MQARFTDSQGDCMQEIFYPSGLDAGILDSDNAKKRAKVNKAGFR
jgi:hypothetical protein